MNHERGGEEAEANWSQYNEHLVQRGEILLSLESLKGWQRELEELNQGKNGRPFSYPHSLILFWGTLRVVFHLPYRQLEGLARGLKKLVGLPAPDYSTLSLRLPKLDLDLGYEPGAGANRDRRGRHWDQGDQPREVDEKEAEGVCEDPCSGRH